MLKEIFESLLPDNIKDIELVQDAIDIFVKNLEENSEISIQIRDMFTSDNDIIKENLFKVYLNSLFTILEQLQEDQVILKKLNDAGRTNALVNNDIKDILNEEYFITSKTFKQNKGTRLGIEYAYNLTKKIEGDTTAENLFRLIEQQPFHFRTEGSIFKEMYERVVKPLSHPIGFTHTYQQIARESLTELFGIEFIYDVKAVEVRCIDGNYDVFTPDSTPARVKEEFLQRNNILTGELFTEEEYERQVNVNLNKVIKNFETEATDIGTHLEIIFTDGTYLEQYPSPLQVYYRNYVDELEGTQNYLKQYSDHCSLFVEYDQDFKFTYSDSLSSAITLNLSHINDLGQPVREDEIFYGIIGIENAFKVGGDVYNYVQGLDETHPNLLVDDTSTDTYITKLIGELKDGDFTPPDTLVNGLFTEGNNYVLSTIDDITNEEMFIDSGRSLFRTNTHEHYVMTNSGDVYEEFNIFQITTGGNYLNTTEDQDIELNTINAPDWDPAVNYSFGQYVMFNDVMYVSINKNDLDLNDNINKQPDLFLSINQDDINSGYWKVYDQPAEYGGFYLYSLVDQVYFRMDSDV
jgi:hypothetical protein